MIPIQNLLHRIRWDPEYGAADFRVGYFDRVEHRIVTISMNRMTFPNDTSYAFEIIDNEGTSHFIPFHRICRVCRNGKLIWQRKRVAEATRH